MVLIQKYSSSFRAKLLTMFIILTCVPFISVGLISHDKSFNTVFANSKSSTLLLADQLSRDIDNLFADTRKLLELGNNPNVLHYLFSQSDNYSDAKNILNTMASYRQTYKYDSVLNITMTNLYGRGISERKGVFQLEGNPLRNPNFAYLIRNPDAVLNIPSSGKSAIDRLDGFQYNYHNVISIISTVKQRVTHEIIGFIIIDLDDSIIKSYFNTVTIGSSGFLYVADDSGSPIFGPSHLSGQRNWPNKEQLSAMLNRARPLLH